MTSIRTTYKVGNQVFKRPICQLDGCTRPAQIMNTSKSTGRPTFRHYCSKCHINRREAFREKKELFDLRSAPCCSVSGCSKKTLVIGSDRKGNIKFTKFCIDHVNIVNAYSVFRKTYCENLDGRLGFKCTSTILISAQLDVDHIDGNPYNNEPSNLQTLCKCCHTYKTIINKDYATPGRKGRKNA